MGRGLFLMGGALRPRCVLLLPGLCMLFLDPFRSRRRCRRKNRGKGGTCRIWPECRCIRAAGGNKIFSVKKILPSLPPVFPPTSSSRLLYGLRNSMHSPGRSRTHLGLSCVHPIGRKMPAQVGWRIRGQCI